MTPKEFILKATRELYTRAVGYPADRAIDGSRVQYADEMANDLVYSEVAEAMAMQKGLAICKLGTVELGCMVSYLFNIGGVKLSDYLNFIKGYPVPLFYYKEQIRLHNNAGVFPLSQDISDRFVRLMREDLPLTDILASYAWCERYVEDLVANSKKVNLDGYYAPFLYAHPWTRVLEGKKVLVIHPFADSIQRQYEKRRLLFDNPEVLPDFANLKVIKAVQTIAGNDCGYKDWFEALEWMKKEMEQSDFDVALIGCGAYGLPLTVHAKRLGKVGVHLAGWTQMLFGIYGNRWLEDQPKYARFINDAWVRPGDDERPHNLMKVEGGCYW